MPSALVGDPWFPLPASGTVGEPFVDDGAGAVVGGREQMGVDAQREGGVGVAEVFGQFLDGDASGEHDAGEVVAELVDAVLAGGGIPGASAPVFLGCGNDPGLGDGGLPDGF